MQVSEGTAINSVVSVLFIQSALVPVLEEPHLYLKKQLQLQ